MRFDFWSSEVVTTHPKGASPDFSRRSDLSELMDSPCSYEDLRKCLRDLACVNRVTFAYRPTLRWLEQLSGLPNGERPLHIVDVGCGGGDMLRYIERWAERKHIAIRLTGIDRNPDAIRAAQEFTHADSAIRWIVGEAYSFDSEAEPVDLVISSLFTHHLSDEGILRFLGWMERVACRGWFVNDLYRNRVSYLGFKILAWAARWHRFVRHDGPVSICRAFLPNEWRRYAEESGLSPDSIRIDVRWPARLCVARVRPS
jgi:SAM-dependent methyltransferase